MYKRIFRFIAITLVLSTMFSNNLIGQITTQTISTSANVYGYLVEHCTALTVNEDIGVINFTHRGNPIYSGVVSSGDIVSSYSINGGTTWSSNVVFPNVTGKNNRYPGGVIYNPSGNTVADSAFFIAFGPVHDGVDWNYAFAGSMQLNNTNISNQYVPTYGALARKGLQSTNDGKFHVITTNSTSSPYSIDTIRLYDGVWNNITKSVDWSVTKFQENFVSTTSSNISNNGFNTAWSEDGITGYYWTTNRDLITDLRSNQPIVWKTTNSGSTWVKMPIFNFGTLTNITDHLQVMKTPGHNYARPMFGGANDGTVDANGNLHIIANVKAAFSNHNDSLFYSFIWADSTISNPIFDVYMTSSGWDAIYLGSSKTVEVLSTESGYSDVSWDLRLQAGRTTDGTKIFASWTDTDVNLGASINNNAGNPHNIYPNLIAVSWDINTGAKTLPTNFTIGTSIDGDCFFHYMSDIIIYENGKYKIPITELDLGNTPTNPVTIKYIKGVEFESLDYSTPSQINIDLGNDVSICSGDFITLGVAAGNPYIYTWIVNNDTISNSTNTISTDSAGTYILIAEYMNIVGSDTFNLSVVPKPVITISGLDNSYCINSSNDTLSVTPAGGGLSGNGINGNIFRPLAAGAGIHNIVYVYIDTNACFSSDTVSTIVYDIPNINLGNDTTICWKNSITLDAGAGFTSYLWNNNATTQTIEIDSFDFVIGNNDYSVEVTDYVNCVNSDAINLIVDLCSGILSPELENVEIIISPNPSNGKFQLEIVGVENDIYNLDIFNAVGTSLFSEKVNYQSGQVKTWKFDFSTFAKGIYYVRLQSNNDIKVKRFIIK